MPSFPRNNKSLRRRYTAYNRTKFIKERTAMMQVWADYLDKLKIGAEIIPLLSNNAS